MSAEVIHGDALHVLREMESGSVDLILTDPPYYRVKTLDWDRAWKSPGEYLSWMGELCEQWQRVLRPNGSLYVFASPDMAGRVECVVREWFAVLNVVTWAKDAGWHRGSDKDALRGYFPASERIIFAEHANSDAYARGETQYQHKCDELRGFVFDPLRAYLDGERERAGKTPRECNEACGNQMAGHYFTRSQWALPTRENYGKLRDLFNATGGDYLRREYDDLRREYENLRRPFNVSATVPFTDVWTYRTVPVRPGKHPCEKPIEMMVDIINASSREGATVLDCFAGSGVVGEAAYLTNRQFIGIEADERWASAARERLTQPAGLFGG